MIKNLMVGDSLDVNGIEAELDEYQVKLVNGI